MPLPAQGTQVAEFVRALALAWKNLAAYPPGHPALANSIEFVFRRLNDLRGPGGEVVFGIANDGLVYGAEKIDSPHAQKFAHALYTRGVALLRFEPTTDVRDIDTFLRVLGVGDMRGTSEPIWESLTSAGVVNVLLQPVDYSSVQVTDNLESVPEKKEPGTLWEEILRALIAGHELSPSAQNMPKDVRSVDELAALILRYIEDTRKGADFDPNATFGVRMLQRGRDSPHAVAKRVSDAIGLYLAGSTGLKKQLVVQQIIQLVRALPEQMRAAVMRSVLRVLATEEASGSLLREFVSDFPPDQVLDALRALSGVKLSTHATLLLQTLTPIEKDAAAGTEAAAPHIVADLVALFAEDDVDRFNPPDHKELLDYASVHVPQMSKVPEHNLSELGDRVETVTEESVNEQVARTLLNLLSRLLPEEPPDAVFHRTEVVFQSYLGERRYSRATSMLEEMQQIALTTESALVRDGIHAWFERIVSGDTIQALVASLVDAKAMQTKEIHSLIEAMGSAATRNLLMALAEEENRSRRRRLFDLLSSLGTVIVPEVARYLSDQRWYVVRNMIVLLRAVNDRSSLGEIRRLSQHPDLRVRLEAIKTLLALEPSVPRALLENAINDRDPKLAETAIALVGNYGIREAVDPLLQILNGSDILGTRKPVRLRAIKALGELADPVALPRLERFFRDPFLPWPKREERRAVYEALAFYPPDARAPFVAIGLQSRDPEIRTICMKLAR